jgi:hypothetical protein
MNLKKPIIIPVLVSGTSDIGTLCARINDMCLEEYDKQAPVEMLIIDNFMKEDEETGETVLTISARILKVCHLSNVQYQYQLINIVLLILKDCKERTSPSASFCRPHLVFFFSEMG